MTNHFGQKYTFTYTNSNEIFSSYIEITISGIEKKFLCNDFEYLIIKNIGYNVYVENDSDKTFLLLDGFENNQYTGEMRICENIFSPKYKKITSNTFETKIVLPLFSSRYIETNEYLKNLNEIYNYKVEIIFEFCELKDVVVFMNNDKIIDKDKISLDYKILY